MTHVEVVAELGLNHNGEMDMALLLVDAAAQAGCDAVKVQAYRCEDFLPVGHPDWAMFKACEMTRDDIRVLTVRAHAHGMNFGATPTNAEDLEWLTDGCDFLKNGSDFLLRHDLIWAMVETGLPTWVSVGMATPAEINRLPRATNVHLMHCTSAYPCPDDEANLARLRDYEGFSDHTQGTTAAIVAATLGVKMIEKHFTLDKWLPGPDHHFSADPAEMAQLVTEVRRVERMLGTGEPGPTASELVNRDKWRVTEGGLRG